VEHGGGGVEQQGLARRHLGAVPALALGVSDQRHVIGEDLAKARIGQHLRTIGDGDRVGAAVDGKGERRIRLGAGAFGHDLPILRKQVVD
jgi:hypothetical protein